MNSSLVLMKPMRTDDISLKFYSAFIIMVLVAGCATPPEPKNYTKFNTVSPRSILIVPVVNRSAEVEAPDYFLSTISVPVAEQGYYIFPVNMVKRVMEDDGLSDADMVHAASTPRLCSIFGSDAVLYVVIENWEAAYMVLTTQVKVEMTYLIKDCQNGEELWKDHQMMVWQPSSGGGGGGWGALIAMAVKAVIAKAAPNYIPLAKQANAKVFTYPGPGIPPGPYLKKTAGEKTPPKKTDDPTKPSLEAN